MMLPPPNVTVVIVLFFLKCNIGYMKNNTYILA